jgi:hypothetical protein
MAIIHAIVFCQEELPFVLADSHNWHLFSQSITLITQYGEDGFWHHMTKLTEIVAKSFSHSSWHDAFI